MAVLQQSTGNGRGMRLFELAWDSPPPEGTFPAKIIDICDKYGVERKKFESEEIEKVDLTAFLFGFRDEDGHPHKIDSKCMKISGNEKSALYAFLKSILGKAPAMGWDYCELKGRAVLLTVEHQPRRDGDGVFAAIAAVSPLPKGFAVPAEPAPPKAKPTPKPKPAAPAILRTKSPPISFSSVVNF
jgi:hypothetical protein